MICPNIYYDVCEACALEECTELGVHDKIPEYMLDVCEIFAKIAGEASGESAKKLISTWHDKTFDVNALQWAVVCLRDCRKALRDFDK